MIDLAQHKQDEFIPLKDISKRQAISIKYLEQITSLLSKYGLLQSVRGPQGGYKLARPTINIPSVKYCASPKAIWLR